MSETLGQQASKLWHSEPRTFKTKQESVNKLAQIIDAAIGPDWKCPVPELKDSFPMVLYLKTAKERDELILEISQAQPNLRSRKL